MSAAIPYAILGYGRNRAELQRAIDCATYLGVGQIRDGRAPLWWEDDAIYRREMHRTLPVVERIQTAEELSAMGAGDCDDHAPALAASLQVIGVPARAVVIESPGIGYHVVVVARDRRGQRRVIDPSARRGMLMGESRATKRDARRRRMRAALTRAASLAAEASRLAPGSRARDALIEEAKRLARSARGDARALESEPEGDDDAE